MGLVVCVCVLEYFFRRHCGMATRFSLSHTQAHTHTITSCGKYAGVCLCVLCYSVGMCLHGCRCVFVCVCVFEYFFRRYGGMATRFSLSHAHAHTHTVRHTHTETSRGTYADVYMYVQHYSAGTWCRCGWVGMCVCEIKCVFLFLTLWYGNTK